MSLLHKYVSDVEDDGTYTLNLDAVDTRALWDEIDELQRENRALKDTLEAVRALGVVLVRTPADELESIDLAGFGKEGA
jgi:hypothetical protein